MNFVNTKRTGRDTQIRRSGRFPSRLSKALGGFFYSDLIALLMAYPCFDRSKTGELGKNLSHGVHITISFNLFCFWWWSNLSNHSDILEAVRFYVFNTAHETPHGFSVTLTYSFFQMPYMTVHHSTPRTTKSLASTNCLKTSFWVHLSLT